MKHSQKQEELYLKLNSIGYDEQRINPFLTNSDIINIWNDPAFIFKIKKPKFKKCQLITNEGFKIMFESRHLEEVDSLAFNNCVGFTNESLNLLAENLHKMKLESLTIKDSLEITNEGLNYLIKKMRLSNIQRLNISKCPNVTDTFIIDLASDECMKNLTYLKFANLKITEKAIETLCKSGYVNNINTFDISGCNILIESSFLLISNSLCFERLETLIFDNLDQITSFTLKEILESSHGKILKGLSLFNCNLVDDKIFSYLTLTTSATSIEYLILMSKSINDWKALIPYIKCENVNKLKILKLYQSYNRNEFAMDNIDKAFAISKTLKNLNTISVCSEMKLKKFLKSENAKNITTIEFIPYELIDESTHIVNNEINLKEIRSYLKYHRDKRYQVENFLQNNPKPQRLLLSNDENINTKKDHVDFFFENLNILTLVKITNEKLIKKVLLEYNFSNLEVIQIIRCCHLKYLIELLFSYELTKLHTLYINLAKTDNNYDDPSELINKISRSKLPKLHTLVINDQTLTFHEVENLFISPLMNTIQILKLKSTNIREESVKKLCEYFNPKQLRKLKAPQIDIEFVKTCLSRINYYFQLYAKNLIYHLSSTSTIINHNYQTIGQNNTKSIIIPNNIEIIVHEISNSAMQLTKNNQNIIFYLKNFEFFHILKISKIELDNITVKLVPYVKSLILDPSSRDEALDVIKKSKQLIARIQRVNDITISWKFEDASYILDDEVGHKITNVICTGEVDRNFYRTLSKLEHLEVLEMQNTEHSQDLEDSFEEFLQSNAAKNLTTLKIMDTEWFNDDLMSLIITHSQKLKSLKTLCLIRNKNISSKSIVSVIKNSKFPNITIFQIGDLKEDFNFTQGILSGIENSFLRNVFHFNFEKFNEIKSLNIRDIKRFNNILEQINNIAIKSELIKIFAIKLLESYNPQDKVITPFKDMFHIIKNDIRFSKKIKMNSILFKILIANDTDIYYDPSILCEWYYNTLVETNTTIDNDIIELIVNNPNIIKYIIKKWHDYDKISNDVFSNIISSIQKPNQFKKLIEKMSYKFCTDDILNCILKNNCINEIEIHFLLEKFRNSSRQVLINVLKIPNSKLSLDYFIEYCDENKNVLKNIGETILYDVPVIKNLTILNDILIDKLLKYFITLEDQSLGKKLLDLYPKIFNIEADEIIFHNNYSLYFIYLFKSSQYFNKVSKLTIYADPSLLLQEADDEILNRLSELKLHNCILKKEELWMHHLNNLKSLTLDSITQNRTFIRFIQDLDLKTEELVLNNFKYNDDNNLDDFWADALKNFKFLKKLTLSNLKISSEKLHEILNNDSLENIEYLTIKYLPFFTLEHLRILGINQPNLKFFTLSLHQITNKYLEIVAKSPHLEKLEVLKIIHKNKTINFNTGLTYILNSTSLVSFKYDEFFTENAELLTDDIINKTALRLNIMKQFKKLNLTKSTILPETFAQIINCLDLPYNELIRFIEGHTFASFFTNDIYLLFTDSKYMDAIVSVNLDKVYNKLKMRFLQLIMKRSITQFYIRKFLSDYSDQITNDLIDFIIKFKDQLSDLGIILILNSELHLKITNLSFNQLISTFPYPNIPLAYEWAIIDPHWRNMLEYDSLAIFINSINGYFIVFPDDIIDFDRNIYLTSNGNVELLQEINRNTMHIYTKYLNKKFKKLENEVFDDRYNFKTLERDDICGEYILKLIKHTPFVKCLKLNKKNFSDKFCKGLASIIMQNNKKNSQHMEEIYLNDNPRITNVGLKYLYSMIVMDDKLNNVDVYCDKEMRKSDIDIVLSIGVHNTLKVKYSYYFHQYKQEGLKKYDELCIPIFIYSIICFPLALLQCFEDKIVNFIKYNKTLQKFYKWLNNQKRKITKSQTHENEIILDEDPMKTEKFIFTRKCVELNIFLGNALIWTLLVIDIIIHYIICFTVSFLYNQGCQNGFKWEAYLIYGIHALFSSSFEFYLMQKTKTKIADPKVLDTSISDTTIALVSSLIARINLFTDTLFMVSAFACGYQNIAIASLVILGVNGFFLFFQVFYLYFRYLLRTNSPYYDSYLGMVSKFAYTIQFGAVAKVLEKFTASNSVKIGEHYMPQIIFTTLMKFFFENVPQGILQFIKLIDKQGEYALSSLAFAATIVNFFIMSNAVARIQPSICTPEMIDELSRSIRNDKTIDFKKERIRINPLRIRKREITHQNQNETGIRDNGLSFIQNNDHTSVTELFPLKDMKSNHSMIDMKTINLPDENIDDSQSDVLAENNIIFTNKIQQKSQNE